MNKSVLALGTALSIFALTPAIAQESPAVDCNVAANAQDPACVNKTNMNNTQSGATTRRMTDQRADHARQRPPTRASPTPCRPAPPICSFRPTA